MPALASKMPRIGVSLSEKNKIRLEMYSYYNDTLPTKLRRYKSEKVLPLIRDQVPLLWTQCWSLVAS